ncbi:hypothetical protein [Streptomyces sp. NPDC005141]
MTGRPRAEQQTTLYRHIKQLHTRGLIETAETRLVPDIVEHRYSASQSFLVLDPAFFNSHSGTDDTAAMNSEAPANGRQATHASSGVHPGYVPDTGYFQR